MATLFQAGLRRCEAAALLWRDIEDAADGEGVLIHMRASKSNQEGDAPDTRYVKGGFAAALRRLRFERGASTTETMLAGGWKTARMVAHYSAGATAERGAVAKYL